MQVPDVTPPLLLRNERGNAASLGDLLSSSSWIPKHILLRLEERFDHLG